MNTSVLSEPRLKLTSPPFGIDFGQKLADANSAVTYKEFEMYRGKGFVLANEDLFLSYRMNHDNTENVQLIFHKLTQAETKKLVNIPQLREEWDGIDLFRIFPFNVELLGPIRREEIFCEALYIHRSFPQSNRLDYNDYCAVGRTIQAFQGRGRAILDNTVVNPSQYWFDNGSKLLRIAADKYNFIEKVRRFNTYRLPVALEKRLNLKG